MSSSPWARESAPWREKGRLAIAASGTPPDSSTSAKSRHNGGRYAFMRRVLQGEIAGERYRRRQVMVEPIFADTKFNRGIDRFLRRGRSAARSEWRLITAGGNLRG
jgi:hypothetical protein